MTVFLSVAAVLLLLLFSPVIISFTYDDGRLDLKARYLFVGIDLMKRMKKPPKPEKPEAEKKEKKEKKKKEKRAKKRPFSETAGIVWELLKASRKAMRIIRKHLIFYKIKVTAVVGGPDAHTTGNSYAAYCTIIPNLISLLDSVFSAREPEVLILPNFMSEKTYWSIAFKMRLAPGFVLAAAFYILLKAVKILLKKQREYKKVKGGKRHERAASNK